MYLHAIGFKSKLAACLLGKCYNGFLNVKREAGLVTSEFPSKSSGSITSVQCHFPEYLKNPLILLENIFL